MSNEAKTWAYSQTGLSGTAKAVLVALAEKANDTDYSCFPGQQTLAEMTGFTDRTLRTHLAVLELAGLLKRERRFNSHGHRTSDRYVLSVPTGKSFQRKNIPVENPTSGRSDHRKEIPSLPENPSVPTGKSFQVIVREPSEEPSVDTPRLTKSDIAKFFDEFWKIYPRRVGKRGAQTEFERAVKRASPQEIISGAERYRDDPNRDEQFTKHPSTWLHQDCWGDDPLPARGKSASRPERYWEGAS